MTTTTLREWARGKGREERITLEKGETAPAAGTSKAQWKGPGTFRRVTWPDGGRDDHEETAALSTI